MYEQLKQEIVKDPLTNGLKMEQEEDENSIFENTYKLEKQHII